MKPIIYAHKLTVFILLLLNPIMMAYSVLKSRHPLSLSLCTKFCR